MSSDGITLSMQCTDLFFDSAHVRRQVEKGKRIGLKRAGQFLRVRARSKLRRRKKVSSTGSPPHVHSKDRIATLKNIRYVYDAGLGGVFVGPVKLNQKNEDWIAGGGSIPIPKLMEKGGVVTIVEKSTDKGATWRRANRRRTPRPWERYRRRRAIYKPREFMGPALEDEVAAGGPVAALKDSVIGP